MTVSKGGERFHSLKGLIMSVENNKSKLQVSVLTFPIQERAQKTNNKSINKHKKTRRTRTEKRTDVINGVKDSRKL